MSYDEQCYQLAESFLADTGFLHTNERADKLAQAIQQTIEDFIATERDNYEPPDDPVAWSGGFATNH